jgi:fructokinase
MQVATGSSCCLDSTPAANENDVLCMGEVLIDFVATDSNVGLCDVNTFTVAAGGAPANVAVGVRRLGLSSGFVGKVGNDPFGVKLRNELTKAGVDTQFLLVAAHGNNTGESESENESRTTIVFGSVWDDGHKDLCFYRGADRCLLPEEITLRVLEGAKCVHYGSITFLDEPAASAQHKAIRMARERGLMITYDPNYRPTLSPNEEAAHRVIMQGFQYAHLAKIRQEEWHVATGHKDLQCGIQAVLDQGVELVVMSRGEQGAFATNGDYIVESPALTNLDIVETTGEGDGFMAAMISRLLPEFLKHSDSLKHIDKGTVQAALDFANVVGGLTCTKAGAIPALPTAQEVDSFLASRRRQADPSVVDGNESTTLAKMMDHTFLKPYCQTTNDMEKVCREARQYEFAMVAVHPAQVETCCQLLQGTDIRVGAAIGFPLGQTT